MTETERWVNEVCERIVAGGQVGLYRDLYKGLRQSLPCGKACRLIEAGLRLTRGRKPDARTFAWLNAAGARARAIAALKRLARWADLRGVRQYAEANDVV